MTVREEFIERLRTLDPGRRIDAVDELLQLLLADPESSLPEELRKKIEAFLAEPDNPERQSDQGRDR